VPDKPKRRRFPSSYKLRIVEAFLACSTPEQRGALARKEGLYYGQITDWVEAHRHGGLAALDLQRTGPKPAPAVVPRTRLAEVERELALWKARAERAEALCEVQKKLSSLLGLLSVPSNDKP
jgi:transposase